MYFIRLGSTMDTIFFHSGDRFVGLVVKASASKAEDPGFESHLHRDFFLGQIIPVI